MNPRVLKLGMIVLILGTTFGAGWTVNGWRLESGINAREAAAAEAKVEAVNAALAKVAEQEKLNNQIVKDYQAVLIARNARVSALLRRLDDATLASTDPVRPFSPEFVSDLNGLSRIGSGMPGADPAPANTAGTQAPAGGTADVTRADLVRWYGEVVKKCGEWRELLVKIYKWDEGESK